MKIYKSKLPKEIKDPLTEELKMLVVGNIHNIHVGLDSFKTSFGVAWISDNKSSYDILEDMENFDDFISFIRPIIEKEVLRAAKPCLKKHNLKIRLFMSRFKTVCKKYNADLDMEFELLIDNNGYDLNNFRKWGK